MVKEPLASYYTFYTITYHLISLILYLHYSTLTNQKSNPLLTNSLYLLYSIYLSIYYTSGSSQVIIE